MSVSTSAADAAAAVGSVGHILRAAFKTLYAPPPGATPEDHDAAGHEAAAAPATTEGEAHGEHHAPEAKHAAAGDAAQVESSPATEAHSAPAPAVDPLELELERIAEERAAEEWQRISAELEHTETQSSQLRAYLRHQQDEANKADEEDAVELRKRGLVQGSEVPLEASHLRLDRDLMQQFGLFSSSLVVARDLVAATEHDLLEKTGNLPKPDLPNVPSFSSTKGDPHYLATTGAQANRVKANDLKIRYSKKMTATSRPETDTAAAKTAVSKSANSSPSTKKFEPLTPAQLEAEEAVLKRMNHKLNFLRNPRYENVPSSSPTEKGNVLFGAEPSTVEFTDYQAKEMYRATLLIRNNSHLSRHMRVLPPTSVYFTLESVQFPSPDGMIAPGMACRLVVTFYPNSLIDFHDHVTVVTEAGEFQVPLWAHRKPPVLSLPLTIDAGNCMLGDVLDTTYTCTNTGGPGRFRCFPEEDWPSPASPTYGHTRLELEPFTVWPSSFELGTNQSVDIHVRFFPKDVLAYARKFIMLCDNCDVTTFTVVGESCDLKVDLSHIGTCELAAEAAPPLQERVRRPQDGSADADVPAPVVPVAKPVPPALTLTWGQTSTIGTSPEAGAEPVAITRPPSRLLFPPINPGVSATRTITVVNRTPVVLPFNWELVNWSANVDGDKPADGPENLRLPKPDAEAAVPGSARSSAGSVAAPKDGLVSEQPSVEVDDGATTARTATDLVPQSKSEMAFAVSPSGGTLQPGVPTVFNVTFSPQSVSTFRSVARLKISGVPVDPRKTAKPAATNETEDSPAATAAVATTTAAGTGEGEADGDAASDAPSVEHEASVELTIDQLPHIERHIVDALFVGLQGAAQEPMVVVTPPIVAVPGALTPGQVAIQQVRVWNQGAMPVAFQWGVPRCMPGTPNGPSPVSLSPASGSIPPGGCVRVEIAFTAASVGRYNINIPCILEHGSGVNVQVTARVEGGQVRIMEPEVDFGLVPVSGVVIRKVHIQNISDTPVDWTFQQLARNLFLSSPKTARSVASGSTAAVAATEAVLKFSPDAGVLPPKGTAEVSVECHAGTQPQRLREMFQCSVLYGNRVTARVRGEVQAPKVYLSTQDIALGTTFTTVQVQRVVTLTNLSNLLAPFSWEASSILNVEDPLCGLSFSPDSGVLQPKEQRDITVTFMPKRPGRLEGVCICDIAGMAMPLGFNLTSVIKGLVVAFVQAPGLPAKQPVGGKARRRSVMPTDPAAAEAKATAAAKAAGAEPGVLPVLNFGSDFQTFTSKTLVLAIYNMSGIPAPVTAGMRRFVSMARLSDGDDTGSSGVSAAGSVLTTSQPATAPQPPQAGGSRASLRTTTATLTAMGATHGAPRKLLGAGHEKTVKFQSEPGKAMLQERSHKERMRAMLSARNGVAFDVTPTATKVQPWGVEYIAVTCVADMPGSYRDELVVEIEGNPTTRIPVRVGVVGSPLQFSENCVGLEMWHSPPVLTFGDVVRNTEPRAQTITIVNTSPVAADLLWKVRRDTDKEPPVVVISLKPTGSRDEPVSLQMTQYSEDAVKPPFRVTPELGRVPALGSATFTVEATPVRLPTPGEEHETEGPVWARLVADAQWISANKPTTADLAAPSVTSVATTGTAATGTSAAAGGEGAEAAVTLPPPTRLVLRSCINPIVPHLQVDKRDSVDGRPYIKFGVWSTAPVNDPSFTRHITLANPIPTPLTFTMSVTGPFTLKAAKTNAPKHPLASERTVHRPLSASGTKVFILPHLNNVQLDVEFDPIAAQTDFQPSTSLYPDGTLSLRKGDLQAAGGGRTSVLDQGVSLRTEYRGAVLITFTDGTVQEVMLRGEILRPMLAAAPAVMEFGVVHVEVGGKQVVHVANPTSVDADWKLQHIPVPAPKPRVTINAAALGLGGPPPTPPAPGSREVPVDDPSVFQFSSTAGVLPGPTAPLEMASAMPLRASDPSRKLLPIEVTFKPAANVFYRSRFRFMVRKGEGFDVVICGKGSYAEERTYKGGAP